APKPEGGQQIFAQQLELRRGTEEARAPHGDHGVDLVQLGRIVQPAEVRLGTARARGPHPLPDRPAQARHRIIVEAEAAGAQHPAENGAEGVALGATAGTAFVGRRLHGEDFILLRLHARALAGTIRARPAQPPQTGARTSGTAPAGRCVLRLGCHTSMLLSGDLSPRSTRAIPLRATGPSLPWITGAVRLYEIVTDSGL